jgi:hypothetical protein
MMRKRWLAILALVAALGWGAPVLMADHGDKDNKHEHGNKHFDNDDDQGRRGDRDDRWERRGGYEYRVYDRDGRPPGWSKGKKTGWGNCGLPPGQAKKYGCRTYVYEGRPHYYYQDDYGRIIIRRPEIHAHAGVDVH